MITIHMRTGFKGSFFLWAFFNTIWLSEHESAWHLFQAVAESVQGARHEEIAMGPRVQGCRVLFEGLVRAAGSGFRCLGSLARRTVVFSLRVRVSYSLVPSQIGELSRGLLAPSCSEL